MKQVIKDFIAIKNVAVMGASRSGTKFGNTIANELKQRGYHVYLVHPDAEEIGGEKCFASIEQVKGKAQSVVICLPPLVAARAFQEAAQAGIRHIWLQQGSQSQEAASIAAEYGIEPITGKCLLMYAEPVSSYHAWHRGFARLFGQY